ncbi:MAG: CPBP family intramembrane metalloprotease [Actinobacteria bacterium]|nr:CPBP family intramembrane metalloprotease [Actinomycetota bacterium]
MASVRSWWPIWAIVPVLLVVNVASNELVPKAGYVPFAVASTAAVLAIGRYADHLSWEAVGLGRRHLASGLRWGLVIAAITAAVLVAGALLPATRELFEDRRVESLSGWGVVYAAFVRVPLGTVLLEEVAFRGVLPAMFALRTSRWRAIGISAVLFGLWHVLPSLGMGTVNPVAEDAIGDVSSWWIVLGSVLSTAAVGVWFSFLRERTGSLAAPMLAHWSTNALGYLVAYAVIHTT